MKQFTTNQYLPKLLAQENIDLEFSNKFQTAAFDLNTRKLYIPTLEYLDKVIYDMFVSHEVGHALFTPLDEHQEAVKTLNSQLINIIEDARIEKLIIRKYPALRDIFIEANKTLIDKKFIHTTASHFWDRINIHYKLSRTGLEVEFSEDEKDILKKIDKLETFQDVLDVVKELQDSEDSQDNQDSEDSQDSQDSQDNQDSEDSEDSQDNQDSEDSEDSQDNQDSQDSEDSQDNQDSQDSEDEFMGENVYNLPKNTNRGLVIKDKNHQHYSEFIYDSPIHKTKFEEISYKMDSTRYKNLIKQYEKDVKSMISEFDKKKAATNHKKKKRSTQGDISMERLWQYKTTDNIFLKRQSQKKGKNHGLLLFLDLSGSMRNILKDVAKQVVYFAMFCKKLRIPYKVYGFTCEQPGTLPRSFNNYDDESWNIPDDVRFIDLLNSEMNQREFNEGIFKVLNAEDIYEMYFTPLNNLLYLIPQIVNEFKKKHNVEIMNTIILSDGCDSDGTAYTNGSVSAPYEFDFNQDHILQSNNKFYKSKINYTDLMITRLNDQCDTNLIWFFFEEKRGKKNRSRAYLGFYNVLTGKYDYTDLWNEVEKNRIGFINHDKIDQIYVVMSDYIKISREDKRDFNQEMSKRKNLSNLLRKFADNISKKI